MTEDLRAHREVQLLHVVDGEMEASRRAGGLIRGSQGDGVAADPAVGRAFQRPVWTVVKRAATLDHFLLLLNHNDG